MSRDEGTRMILGKDPISHALIRRIRGMKPGDKLASERQLAEELGVSRTALRDRAGKLQSMGILERRGRMGTFVVGLRPETISEVLTLGLMASDLTLESIVTVRMALERQAALEAASRHDHVSVAHMAVAVDMMDETNDGERLRQADMDFHRALFDASGSPALRFFSQVLSQVLAETVQSLSLSEDRVTMRKVHRDILAAVQDQEYDAVLSAIDQHFEWLDVLINNHRSDDRAHKKESEEHLDFPPGSNQLTAVAGTSKASAELAP
ncbi:FadR/GntR family transcriptional regulator [Arthrobacter roseus]|uniref:FadR/GntR family transcriptional regulator n=1 Tax=Arthrobacter roseus TaxID=136274 RepID=UPI0019655DDC|nr:FCD domain-containing protein [Arthrobacter roseus]MBM7847841.1 GntR family transcriptional repressor for pyruvate dehydrogenase complex [Arthrobacter roseus]